MATPPNMTQASLAKREAAWVVRLFNREGYSKEHQELKFTLHRKMLSRVNLEALSVLPEQRMREEVRSAVARLVEKEGGT